MFGSNPNPSGWRIAAAFLVAPFAGAFAMSCLELLPDGPLDPEHLLNGTMLYATLGAYPVAILVGLPLFAFLVRRVQPTVFRCAMAGAFVAAFGIVLVLSLLTGGPMALIAEAGLLLAELLVQVVAAGVVGGIVFWIVAAARFATSPSHGELP